MAGKVSAWRWRFFVSLGFVFRTWTARIVLAALTLEVGLIFSLYSGDFALLRRSEEGLFRSLLSWAQQLDPNQVILETSADGRGWDLRQLETSEKADSWDLVEVPQARELFDEAEPKPSEYAVLLAKLHQAGAREVAFSKPLTWESAAELELRALDSSLRPFREVLLPIDLQEVPEPKPPEYLENSLLAKDALVGVASGLPVMNQVAVPPSVTAHPGIQFAFPDFGGRDLQYRVPGRLPVLTRWEGGFLPSWSLSLAMRMEGVPLDELQIIPGRYLRLGENGPVVPLDDFGRAKVMQSEGLERELISATALFTTEEEEPLQLSEGVVLVDTTNQQGIKSRRLVAEAFSLLRFPRPSEAKFFERLGLGWEVLLYFQIVLMAFVALYLKPFSQLIVLTVLCIGLFAFVLGLLNLRELWTPILPLIVAMTVSWCLVGYLQQIAHPLRDRKRRKKRA